MVYSGRDSMAFQIPCLLFLLVLHVDSNKGYEDTCMSETQIFVKEANKCCKKCPPGYRVKSKCSKETETVCEACSSGTWLKGYNYYNNCFRCTHCNGKSFVYAQHCSTEMDAKCICKPGMYCVMRQNVCSSCKSHTKCIPGHGVIEAGTAEKNVKCGECPSGTFSNQTSSTEECRPHSTCGPEGFLWKGNSTSDTVCIRYVVGPTITTTTTQSTTLRTTSQPLTSLQTICVTTQTRPLNVIPAPSSGSPSANTVMVPLVAGVCAIVIVAIVIGIYCSRKKEGTPEKETKVTNGCVEAGILKSASHLECQSLLKHSGPPEPPVSSPDRPSGVPLSGPTSGPSVGHNGVSNGYAKQDVNRFDHPQSPTVQVNVNVNFVASAPSAPSAPPTAPSGSSTPRPNGRPPEPDSDLPLSQEEMHISISEAEQGKEAHMAVPETGGVGMESMDFHMVHCAPKTLE